MIEFKPVTRLSVVIPVFNEQASLPPLIERTHAACHKAGVPFEIILIDDGSKDESANLILDAANAPDSHIVGVFLNRNYGQHAAIMAGFEQAQGDLIITLDADLQNPPEEIPNLVAKANEGYDSVGTVRRKRRDSWLRRLPSKLVNLAVKASTGVEMTDYGCMLRAYRRNVVDAMLLCHERSTFIPILANSFARRVTEIDVEHAEREHGDSKYTFMRLINLMFDLLTSMTTAPLRLLSMVGMLIAALGFLFAVLLVTLRIIYGPTWAGEGLFLLFAVLFTFIGAQFIGLGLLGEYIGRIYNDVRARPRFFIHQVVKAKAASDLSANRED